jgi:hypothetical protein
LSKLDVGPYLKAESLRKYPIRLINFGRLMTFPLNLTRATQPAGADRFGDVAFITFMVVQALDGVLTYLGVHIWGPAVEANPIISSAVSFAGVGTGLAAAKLFAVGLGMVLHLRRVHGIVALLTAFYLAVAIVPWTMLFLTQ